MYRRLAALCHMVTCASSAQHKSQAGRSQASAPLQDEETSAELRAAGERLAAARGAFEEEAARRWRPPPPAVAKLRQAVQRAFDSACSELTAKHGALMRLDRRNTYTLEHRC